MLFTMGTVMIDKNVKQLMNDDDLFNQFVNSSLDKFSKCDWGVTSLDGCRENHYSVVNGISKILAVYDQPNHNRWTILIFTNNGRSHTYVSFIKKESVCDG